MIQAIIKRMADSSFLLKGWSVTMVTALFVLAANTSSKKYYLLAWIPVLMFWFLDSFYHTRERHFRRLYDLIREKEPERIDFSMSTDEVKNKDKYFRMVFSISVFPFYFIILIIIMIAALIQ
jgi:hypothetical protein